MEAERMLHVLIKWCRYTKRVVKKKKKDVFDNQPMAFFSRVKENILQKHLIVGLLLVL
jgi:hypothetical protein